MQVHSSIQLLTTCKARLQAWQFYLKSAQLQGGCMYPPDEKLKTWKFTLLRILAVSLLVSSVQPDTIKHIKSCCISLLYVSFLSLPRSSHL